MRRASIVSGVRDEGVGRLFAEKAGLESTDALQATVEAIVRAGRDAHPKIAVAPATYGPVRFVRCSAKRTCSRRRVVRDQALRARRDLRRRRTVMTRTVRA